ncbi:hypothetical protein LTR62_004097 [Meristemomyces frigidus]|uniref:Alpha/beta hydrolase fold-3 domain-containing protein n=1 Tax=Meristemomyces frigidus TaxID=1508187 RepID=A0AAN7TJE1_9PEZI|nr:hypothetical protein LTR62_004097 [Meristemomyces frigidus]
MPFNTLSVASAVTPSVIETYFSHYLNRGPLRQKPTAHISYHEGLRLIRQFLDYSSKHSVEELQAFTTQWVPVPVWVRTYDLEIAPQFLERAARILHAHLGRRDVDKIGGKTWWQWRRPEAPLRAEWIEMKKDFNERKKAGTKCDRCILYVHGGAYYFGSVDEHRYQMQRHARKLKARILAPRYRLAPQFPFPCGLQDCISTYLYLLEHFRPEQILFAGDSAGGGMVLSLLVILRDQGLPLPAGTILLSPWVDLTHSFPSVAGDGAGDYIPPHGFHHKPSMAWPPPPNDQVKRRPRNVMGAGPSDAVELPATADLDMKKRKKRRGNADVSDEEDEDERPATAKPRNGTVVPTLPGSGDELSIVLDGTEIRLKEQLQLYAPNDLLAHPLVSPVLQPTLGGLPPMLIQVGGAELLRDEQIYLAHKAASPHAYVPSHAIMREYDPSRQQLNQYPPTHVQLQVWDDLCHVPHTLSFTRPAKYMYRSVAQFGAWALAHAQHKGVDIGDNDDNVSIISSGEEDEGEIINASTTDLSGKKSTNSQKDISGKASIGNIGRAGDPLPHFKDHMIRQRVTRHGILYALAPESEIACLALDPVSIGTIKPGPVRKWLARRKEGDARYGNDMKKLAKKKAKELAQGYDAIPDEYPPPTALVNRRKKGVAPEEKKKQKNWGLAMWSGWGSSHDESTLKREEKQDKENELERQAGLKSQQEDFRPSSKASSIKPPGTSSGSSTLLVPGARNGAATNSETKQRRTSSVSTWSAPWSQKVVVDSQRPRSSSRTVVDAGQAGDDISSPNNTGRTLYSNNRRTSLSNQSLTQRPASVAVPNTSDANSASLRVPGGQSSPYDLRNNRSNDGTQAFPYRSLRTAASNPSMVTFDSGAPSSVHSQGAVEMPTGTDNHIELPTPADDHVEMPASPRRLPELDNRPSPVEEPVSAVSLPTASPLPDIVSPVERPAWSAIPARNGGPPPIVSPVMARTAIFDNRSSVLGALGPDGMPITPQMAKRRTANIPRSAPAGASQTSQPTRTSPIATKSYVIRDVTPEVDSNEGTPVTPIDAQRAALFNIRNAPSYEPHVTEPTPDGSVRADDSLPATPVDSQSTAPFKIRNAVFDSRAAQTPTPPLIAPSTTAGSNTTHATEEEHSSPEQTFPKKAGEANDATKAAPFKLRHTVYDPTVPLGGTSSKGEPDSAMPALPLQSGDQRQRQPTISSPEQQEGLQADARRIADRAMTPTVTELPPNTNVSMPTVVSRRPMPKADAPPRPPPLEKDSPLHPPIGGGKMDWRARKRSKELLSTSGERNTTPSPELAGINMARKTDRGVPPQQYDRVENVMGAVKGGSKPFAAGKGGSRGEEARQFLKFDFEEGGEGLV